MTVKKDEIFENIVKTICAIYHECGQEAYNLYSNNGTHAHDHEKEQCVLKGNELEEKSGQKLRKRFVSL